MSYKEIYETIKPFFNKCESNEKPIVLRNASEHLYTDLGMNSLSVVELVMQCENKFNFKMPDDEVKNIETTNDLILLIQKYGNV